MTPEPIYQSDSIEDTIIDFKNGKFIIVLDSQDRENEGDLIIAAESITAAQMAFLVRYTSGLICAPITVEHATRLLLPQMVTANADPKGTAYTITIDSSGSSITTGISAHDRALTCRTLASPSVCANQLQRPGHIIPLQARLGGVRERQGHTEAAIEFCKLAGKSPVAVIAELVEDGEPVRGVPEISENNGMLRRDGCLRFAKQWGIKACTIEDLVAYLEKTGKINGDKY
ncbi:3-4-dihydroxy-2-butanone 4-phosphate synthase RibB [Penicillium cf. griseofulvum]|uniref:3,4-dihydroxy-2-butanone 4-phosphate synthase n=1 Tax=Penicillium cf. griseofulvum TaxID=2972120 RepID=A0A9W9T5B0_9EURO|nr:3-4-dihydroxy-2-butanone 4-phosphate synthase RibB [Penicillium cf. griseofulvum]KAJ5421385.1 3-4-dihydroxy-2-butanone 4-phosphate synthase RibB [Penicillium cf. griseofulvum]KAJ5424617.1 3-4-dihydroxy-2-butanone 4-phosphate synthase RibB [Penicillium cf. griseofulvum]